MMASLLGLVLVSFIITALFIVPFIDLLFYLKRKFDTKNIPNKTTSDTPIHDRLMKSDEATPTGGGIVLIGVLIVLSVLSSLFIKNQDLRTLQILLFTLISFGALGLIDDIRWLTTKRKGKLAGLGRKVLMLVQLAIATVAATMLYYMIGLNNVYVPVLGNLIIGGYFIPFAALVIVSFANAYNISDGLDGLSTGLLVICLFAFLALASTTLNITLAAFIGIWIGALFAYLYFNVYPARIFLGDAGAFGFGATLAVVGLLTGKIIGLAIIGGMYVVIVSSSLLQILSKRFLKRKLLPVAPIHMYFKYIGWEEPKIVARFWLAGAIFAIFGLWLALLST